MSFSLRSRRRSGISLTEIMLALFVLAASFLPIVGVLGTSLRATTKEDAINRAMNLCQEKLNTALQLPFDFFVPRLGASLTAPITAHGVSLNLGSRTIEGATFTASLRVDDHPGTFTVPVRDLGAGTDDPNNPRTWRFTRVSVPYRGLVHKYTMRVEWVPRGETEGRFYTLVTFRARLQE